MKLSEGPALENGDSNYHCSKGIGYGVQNRVENVVCGQGHVVSELLCQIETVEIRDYLLRSD